MAFLVRWAIISVALWITILVIPGIEVTAQSTLKGVLTVILVALIFGLVNAFIKPVIKIVGCLFYIFTLGLISFVVNALLFLLVDWLAGLLNLPFNVDGFWAAFWGAILMGILTWAISLVIPDRLEGKA
jgi:putative membrane protein